MKHSVKDYGDLHVLVIAPGFPSLANPWAFPFIREQVLQLCKRVERVTVLSPTTSVPFFARGFRRGVVLASIPKRYSLIEGKCEVLFPRYLKAPGQAFLWWTTAQWCRLVSKIVAELAQTRPVSLIHANAGGESSWSAIQVAKRYGIPCVVTYQGSEVHTMLANRQNGWKLCRDSFRLADLNISVSRSIERILKTHAQPQGRCEVMLRGVDLRIFFPSLTKDVKRPIVLFVGRITEAKGVYDLLKAWAQIVAICRNAELRVLGPDQTNGRFVREIRSCGYGSSISVMAPVPLSDVAKHMRQAQVFCLPSHGEGTPNSVMEALACGLPVVATNVGGIPDIVIHNQTGLLVNKGDVQGLAEAIISLLMKPVECDRLSQTAQLYANKHFDGERSADSLVRLYRELCAIGSMEDRVPI